MTPLLIGPVAVVLLRRPTITRCCQWEVASVAEHISLGLLRQDLARNRTTLSKLGDVQRLQYLGLVDCNRSTQWSSVFSCMETPKPYPQFHR